MLKWNRFGSSWELSDCYLHGSEFRITYFYNWYSVRTPKMVSTFASLRAAKRAVEEEYLDWIVPEISKAVKTGRILGILPAEIELDD